MRRLASVVILVLCVFTFGIRAGNEEESSEEGSGEKTAAQWPTWSTTAPSKEQLMTLPGIGDAYSQKIIRPQNFRRSAGRHVAAPWRNDGADPSTPRTKQAGGFWSSWFVAV